LDKPADDFVKKTLEGIQSGDFQSVRVRDFLRANNFDDALKRFSKNNDCFKRFEKARE